MILKANIITGLDIGTHKVVCLIGQLNEGKTVDIIGIGSSTSRGLRRGVVVNIDSTVGAISRAVEEAELMANCKVKNVFASISGNHIASHISHGIVAIEKEEVFESDIEQVLNAARAIALPSEREVLHVIPQEYVVDNQPGIREPKGMSGVRLEVRVNVISGLSFAKGNILRSINRAGINNVEIIVSSLASAEAVLTEEEKELGVALIEIGEGTTNIAVFRNGSLFSLLSLPVGGGHLTQDVSIGLRTPVESAQALKIKHGSVMTGTVDLDERIEVPQTGGREPRSILRMELVEIMESRMEEILSLAKNALRDTISHEYLTAGIVLTGGGVQVSEVLPLGEQIFSLPVRLGIPIGGIGGLVDVVDSASHATAVGLLKYGSKLNQEDIIMYSGAHTYLRRFSKKVARFFAEYL